MALKIKFDRLDYQEQAVNSISDVFKNIAFKTNDNKKSNPSFDLQASKSILVNNITKVREINKVDIGDISIKDELVIDTLMETGTGKTFTFLELPETTIPCPHSPCILLITFKTTVPTVKLFSDNL